MSGCEGKAGALSRLGSGWAAAALDITPTSNHDHLSPRRMQAVVSLRAQSFIWRLSLTCSHLNIFEKCLQGVFGNSR
jgi:hypothetical protein